MRTSLLILALLISAVVIKASPTSIQHKGGFGGGFGGQGSSGDGGGHGGPAYESTEGAWKDRVRTSVPSFEAVAGRGKFADRRLLHKGGFGGGFGGQGNPGDGGGHSGPGTVGAAENAWKARVSVKVPSFETVANRGKFADRRLLHKGGFGGGFGGQGNPGDGGGHGGPAYEGAENAWKNRIRSSAVAFDTVASRASDKFADRHLMQENEAEVPEWRDGLAGIKQQVRSSVVGTPLPEDRFVKPQA